MKNKILLFKNLSFDMENKGRVIVVTGTWPRESSIEERDKTDR
jgi:hypothetical protein